MAEIVNGHLIDTEMVVAADGTVRRAVVVVNGVPARIAYEAMGLTAADARAKVDAWIEKVTATPGPHAGGGWA